MASITAVVDSIIHVAIELSQSTWLVAARLPQANKPKCSGFRVDKHPRYWRCSRLCVDVWRLGHDDQSRLFAVLRLAGMASGYTDF